jgi:hypothetical protein
VYVFTVTFTWFVRAVAHLTVLEAGLKIQQFNKIKIRRFLHLITKLPEHSVVCEKCAEAGGDDAPSNFSLRLPIGETFSREATATRDA